jgi:glycosyltransferase involved in cell wall biosynthesis
MIWINWENQRRSTELAKALDAKHFQLISSLPYLLRVMVLLGKTLQIFRREKPGVVFVQNPSMVLASFACMCKGFFKFKLIVDRHSNFKFKTKRSRNPKYMIFHALSRYSVRAADFTVVTNANLRDLVIQWGGRGFVLQDKLPDIHIPASKIINRPAVVIISSFGSDEPIKNILEASSVLCEDCQFYITGDFKKLPASIVRMAPDNVAFTGFLSDEEYFSLLASSDVVMVLTDQDNTLVCGAYEGVSLGKPMILSAKPALMEYFSKGVVYCDNSPKGIEIAVKTALGNTAKLSREVQELRENLLITWNNTFSKFRRDVVDISGQSD